MSSNAQQQPEERRNYRRVSDAVALHIEVVDPDVANDSSIEPPALPDHPTHVVNLSPSGLKCYHFEPFADGDKVRLSMVLFPEQKRLELEALVVNSGEVPQGSQSDRFFAGLAFKNVDGEITDLLLDHIDAVARQSFGGAVKLVYKS